MPVEVVPFCHEHTARVIKALPALEGCEPVLRLGRDLRRCHRQRFSFLLNAFQHVSTVSAADLKSRDGAAQGSGESFGGIRCIFAGDFMQIRPVKCQRLAFEAQCWKELFQDEEQLQTLREVHRHKDI